LWLKKWKEGEKEGKRERERKREKEQLSATRALLCFLLGGK